MKRWDVNEAVYLIQKEGVTVIGGYVMSYAIQRGAHHDYRVPAVVSAILQSPDLPKNKSFETVFYGGAPASKELAREVKTRWLKTGL